MNRSYSKAARTRVPARRLIGRVLIGIVCLSQSSCTGIRVSPAAVSSPKNASPTTNVSTPAGAAPPAYPVSPFVVVPPRPHAPQPSTGRSSKQRRQQPPAAGVPPPVERVYGTPGGPQIYEPDPNARASDRVRRQDQALKQRLRQQRKVLRAKQSGESQQLDSVRGYNGAFGSQLQTPAQIQTQQQQEDLREIQRHGRVY